MRIGIDASRAFGQERTGTENYSYQMIKHVLELPEAKNDEFVLYISPSSIPPLNSSPWLASSTVRGGKGVIYKRISLPFLWTQAGLAARTWLDRLDVLWVPAHTLPLLRKPGLKTVVTIHGIEYEWLPAYENLLQRWYLPLSTKYAVATADKVISVSEFTKSQLISRLEADDRKIEVIHEGVDLSLDKVEEGGDQILKKHRLSEKKYLMFVGTLQPRKNLVKLIEAFSQMRKNGENLDLVIVGKKGWGFEEILAAPSRFGVENYVKFIGYADEKERRILLQNSLAYVQPSITEGFGLPIVEAWQENIPVVSSYGGALAEIVGEAGLLFDPKSGEDMTAKILEVTKDVGKRSALIKAGKVRLAEFSWRLAAIKTYKYITDW